MRNVEQAADRIDEGKFDVLPECVREALGELAERREGRAAGAERR